MTEYIQQTLEKIRKANRNREDAFHFFIKDYYVFFQYGKIFPKLEIKQNNKLLKGDALDKYFKENFDYIMGKIK